MEVIILYADDQFVYVPCIIAKHDSENERRDILKWWNFLIAGNVFRFIIYDASEEGSGN
jgi:hypothetical protein